MMGLPLLRFLKPPSASWGLRCWRSGMMILPRKKKSYLGMGGGGTNHINNAIVSPTPLTLTLTLPPHDDPHMFPLISNNNTHKGNSLLPVSRSNKIAMPIVAVDVDEVLGSFLSALNRFIADRYSLNHSVSEYHVYEFFKVWNCSRAEADIRVHEFFKTDYFRSGIHPIPGALQSLKNLSPYCKLFIVTSRQNIIRDHTLEWIEKYYPRLFHEVHFGNHFALKGHSRPKSEICRSFGAHFLIDDNPHYALECAETGLKVLLFDYNNSYPWCKDEETNSHPLISKVHNWKEVEEHLFSWIAPPT